jgi:hypothetical protein
MEPLLSPRSPEPHARPTPVAPGVSAGSPAALGAAPRRSGGLEAGAPPSAAPIPDVRLTFERGAILVRGARPIDAAGLPGTTWDFEEQTFRAPALRYGEIADALAARRVRLLDRAREGGPAPRAFAPRPLRPREAALLDEWEAAGRRGLVALPPGAARRRVAFAAIARTGLRTLCIVPARPELLVWSAAFTRVYGERVAELGDAPRHEITPVSIATLGVAHRRMCELGALFDLVIADEAQELAAGARGRPMDESIARARLGFLSGAPRPGPSLARLLDRVGPLLELRGVAAEAPSGDGPDLDDEEEGGGPAAM